MEDSFRNVGLLPKSVKDYGLIGRCSSCTLAREKTALIEDLRYCYVCAQKLENNVCDSAVFENTDAKFTCPAGNCNTETNSYRDFYIGRCCEAGSRWSSTKHQYEHINRIQFYFEEAKSKLEIAKKEEEKARNAAEEARKAADEAKEKLDAEKNNHLVLKNKVIYLVGKSVEETLYPEKPPCVVCYEKFCDEKRQESALPCGHRFCFPCLDVLPQKICPTCRKEFTMPQIYKLFQQF